MTLKIRDAGTLRTIKRLTVKVGGVNRRIKTIKGMDGGTLRLLATLADDLAVSAPDASGEGSNVTVTTDSITATVTGGIGPYTYAWSLIANGGGSASTATSPNMATTAFQKNVTATNAPVADTWRVTVTDSTGTTATADITATFVRLST